MCVLCEYRICTHTLWSVRESNRENARPGRATANTRSYSKYTQYAYTNGSPSRFGSNRHENSLDDCRVYTITFCYSLLLHLYQEPVAAATVSADK